MEGNKSKINKLLIPKRDYDRNPFYGLNELPNFLSPFSKSFLEEITFLKSFIDNYLNEEIKINKRKNHFIYNGLAIFLVSKYIDEYHSKVRYLGRLSGFKILKTINCQIYVSMSCLFTTMSLYKD